VGGTAGGGVLASVVPGPRGQAAGNHYLSADASIATLPITPTSLINFGEAVNFPLIFGAMLAVFGAATLAHLLVVSVSRRRREIGLLKMLGFVNGQIASAVAWQASTLAVVGVVVGVPVGVVLGQAVWRAFANNLGAVPVSVVPTWLIVALAAGVVLVANLIAVAPALVATRSKPGDLLRTA
jgi:ABC-type antimicrobial peptide transport system permease subunit